MNKFSSTSRERLETCHPLLQELMGHVLNQIDITIVCGHRTAIEQNNAYADGKSRLKWPKSKHNAYPSLAVDIAPYPIRWEDTESFRKLGDIVIKCWDKIPDERRTGWKLVWGGSWQNFTDLPHYQIEST